MIFPQFVVKYIENEHMYGFFKYNKCISRYCNRMNDKNEHEEMLSVEIHDGPKKLKSASNSLVKEMDSES